ncbi:MAG: TIGR02281 family clan AA aspartic protease [Beijerinckiaceae bacterium]
MFRSALNAFFVLTLASLGLVSYLTAHHGTRSSGGAAPGVQRAGSAIAAPTAAAVPARPLGSQMEIAPDPLGHYAADVEIDGRMIRMLVDTGASLVALRSEDAAALGLDRSKDDFKLKVMTANGVGSAALAHLWRVRIGDIQIYDVDALVFPPGVLAQNLLGMSALRKLSGFEISAGRLVLKQ